MYTDATLTVTLRSTGQWHAAVEEITATLRADNELVKMCNLLVFCFVSLSLQNGH